MKKSIIILRVSYLIGILLLIGVIVFYNWLNSRLETELVPLTKYVENIELQDKLIKKIQSGEIRKEEYVDIFNKHYELEKTRHENAKVLIDVNSSIRNAIASILALQLFFISLYIFHREKT